jgi:hypothetical protein
MPVELCLQCRPRLDLVFRRPFYRFSRDRVGSNTHKIEIGRDSPTRRKLDLLAQVVRPELPECRIATGIVERIRGVHEVVERQIERRMRRDIEAEAMRVAVGLIQHIVDLNTLKPVREAAGKKRIEPLEGGRIGIVA